MLGCPAGGGQWGGWTEHWPPLPGPGETQGSRDSSEARLHVKPLTSLPGRQRETAGVIPGALCPVSCSDPSQCASSVPVQRWSLVPHPGPEGGGGQPSPQGTQLLAELTNLWVTCCHLSHGGHTGLAPWKAGRGGSPGYWLGRQVTPACWGVASVPGVGAVSPHQSQEMALQEATSPV